MSHDDQRIADATDRGCLYISLGVLGLCALAALIIWAYAARI